MRKKVGGTENEINTFYLIIIKKICFRNLLKNNKNK